MGIYYRVTPFGNPAYYEAEPANETRVPLHRGISGEELRDKIEEYKAKYPDTYYGLGLKKERYRAVHKGKESIARRSLAVL